NEVISAQPYADLSRRDFDRVVDFVATGGYSLRTYERFARLRPMEDGRLRIAHPRIAQQYRMNAGTIVDAPMLKVRLVRRRGVPAPGHAARLTGGRVLGGSDEMFIAELQAGQSVVFGGESVRVGGLRAVDALGTRGVGHA